MVLFKLWKIIKRLEIKTNFLLVNNKRIFAFLWIQKRKGNKINFFSKGPKKTEMFVHKKRNVDIPKHYRVNFRIFYSLFFYCTLPRYYHRNRRKSTQNGENKNRNCETGWQENLSHGLDDVRVYLWAAWSRRWSHPLYADLKVLG